MRHFYLHGGSKMDVLNEIEDHVQFGDQRTHVFLGPGLSEEFVQRMLGRNDLTVTLLIDPPQGPGQKMAA